MVTSPAPKFPSGGIENNYLYHNSTLALDGDTGEIGVVLPVSPYRTEKPGFIGFFDQQYTILYTISPRIPVDRSEQP